MAACQRVSVCVSVEGQTQRHGMCVCVSETRRNSVPTYAVPHFAFTAVADLDRRCLADDDSEMSTEFTFPKRMSSPPSLGVSLEKGPRECVCVKGVPF